MIIKTKIESYLAISELKLNKLAEGVFKAGEVKKIDKFIESNPAEYYAIRDKSKAQGTFKLKVRKEDIYKEIEGYSLFSINVSSYNYVDNQLLVGEILIEPTRVSATLSTNSSFSVRDALRAPDFNISTDIFDNDTLNQIPYFDKIYEYIIKNDLSNIIVEFAYFNKPIGINNENIVVYELRTDY